MLIIGLTGTLGAGKGTVVDYLIKKHDLKHFSVRGYLTQEIVSRGLPVNRDSMVLVANDLRARHNPAYIVEQLYNQAIIDKENCIIESLRTPGEVELLKSKEHFYLFAVDADSKTRYQRIRQRNNETDQVSYEEFIQNEQREFTSNDPNKQNLSKCISMADCVFLNNGSLKELFNQVERKYKEIR
jgi:dephospho-CoA kinase